MKKEEDMIIMLMVPALAGTTIDLKDEVSILTSNGGDPAFYQWHGAGWVGGETTTDVANLFWNCNQSSGPPVSPFDIKTRVGEPEWVPEDDGSGGTAPPGQPSSPPGVPGVGPGQWVVKVSLGIANSAAGPAMALCDLYQGTGVIGSSGGPVHQGTVKLLWEKEP